MIKIPSLTENILWAFFRYALRINYEICLFSTVQLRKEPWLWRISFARDSVQVYDVRQILPNKPTPGSIVLFGRVKQI